ncbi:hypothetical protein ACHAWF_014894, partial [Thalassiosira exigua]
RRDSFSSGGSSRPFSPAAGSERGGSDVRDESLERYLRWRGWDVEGILRRRGLDEDLIPSAAGLLSHPLTFPLTLGRHARELSPRDARRKRNNARLCCVGARAECTLPDDFWREFLVAAALARGRDDDEGEGPNERSFRCTIDFVGPDVPKHLASKRIEMTDGAECERLDYRLEMNFHAAYLHEVVLQVLGAPGSDQSSSDRSQRIREHWDGFVLFNPGLGHPNLANKWDQTIRFLVGIDRPILFTAHSATDGERDRDLLEKLLRENGERGGPVRYRTNPYASRMGFVDPFSSLTTGGAEVHVVRPNQSYFLLQ